MKILFIPIFKFIYTVFMSLIEIITIFIICICQLFWYFKIIPKVFKYKHYYTTNNNDIINSFINSFRTKNNYYSAYFKHNNYKSICSEIVFKSNLHYLWGCKPNICKYYK